MHIGTEPRMKRPTIAEIAARAGVSTGAVSYALNGRPGVSATTRKLILEIADEIGWRPSVAARSLSGSRAHSVGLIIARPPDTLGVEPFFMRFIAGLEGELSRQDIALLLQFVDDHRAAIEAIPRSSHHSAGCLSRRMKRRYAWAGCLRHAAELRRLLCMRALARAKPHPGRLLRFASAVDAARRLPCAARSRGPSPNSLRSLRSLRSNKRRQVSC